MVLVSQWPRHEKKLKEMCRSCKLWLFSNHRLGEATVRDLSFHFSIKKVQISIIPHENHENLFRRLIAATRPEMKSHGSSHRHWEQHIAFLIFFALSFFSWASSAFGWARLSFIASFFLLAVSFVRIILTLHHQQWAWRAGARISIIHSLSSHMCRNTSRKKEWKSEFRAEHERKRQERVDVLLFCTKKCFKISSPAFLLSPKSEAISSLLSCCCCWWWPNDNDDRAERTISFSSSDDKLTKHHHHQSDFKRCRWKTWKHDNLTKF